LSRRRSANGLAAFRVAKQRGYEGVVAKRLASVYVEGRSREWLKVKANQEDEFIILGYTAPSGGRKYFGALLLGAFKMGSSNTSEESERASLGMFSPRFIANFNCSNENSHLSKILPRTQRATFLSAKLVAQISYTEWAKDGRLRHPVFLGLRHDKDAKDVALPEPK
jgi:bifunctional non-homologous end joining protein LigD